MFKWLKNWLKSFISQFKLQLGKVELYWTNSARNKFRSTAENRVKIVNPDGCDDGSWTILPWKVVVSKEL